VLRNSNKEVVIKVVKPGVEEVLLTDLNFLYVASKVIEFLNPELSRISLVDVVGDIRGSMLEETDFTKEAQHIQEFSTFLDTSGMHRVATCPFVYKQYTSRR
jgi:aarF domain-containing kinase